MRTGAPRYGEMVINGQRVPNPAELEVIALMVALRASGQTYRAIADELNRLKIPTKRGGHWSAMTVRRIVLAGEVR